MKKLLYPAAALSTLLALASCSNEDTPFNGNDGNGVSFRVEVPASLATRATFGDESMVSLNNLQWSVYDMKDEANPVLVFSSANKSAFQSNQKYENVNLQLVKGAKYQVVFFADNEENKVVTCTDGLVNVNYNEAKSNTANEDAFVGKSSVFTVPETGYSETVTLTRPFAQLNWGTDDINAESVKPLLNSTTATVKIEGTVHDALNILTGELSGEINELTFPAVALNNLPAETFPKVHEFKTYDLIAMNYLLTGETTLTCKLEFSNGVAVNVPDAPFNTNYRTNIYGSLITAPGSFNIVIDNAFNTPDNNMPVKTASEFLDNIAAGNNVLVEEGTLINLTNEGEIALKNGQNITVNGTIQTTRQQISISGAGNEATVEGTGTIVAVGTNGNRPLNVYDGAKLTVKGVTVNSKQNNGGSTIYSMNGNLVLENMKVLECHNFAVGANGGTLTAKNCEFNSDSNNKQGAWSYTVNVGEGCKAVFDDVTVNGIQGGISVDGKGSHLDINSGTYITHRLNGMNGTAFYSVYVCNEGSLTINGGNFISDGPYTIFDGDNDINKPFAEYINIKGGKFNKGTYSQKTGKAIDAAEGYEWKTINEAPFTLTVVKKK